MRLFNHRLKSANLDVCIYVLIELLSSDIAEIAMTLSQNFMLLEKKFCWTFQKEWGTKTRTNAPNLFFNDI